MSDSAGRAFAVSFELASPVRVRILVDDEDAAYPLVVDPLLTGTADATLESGQDHTDLGTHVAGAGDVNGDGFSDVIVGAPDYDTGQTDEEAEFVFYGGSTGVANGSPTNAAARVESDQVDAKLGSSVASGGDVNGDGFAEVIVGAPFYNSGNVHGVIIAVLLGGAMVIGNHNPTNAWKTLDSDIMEARLGISVSGVGDVNGDGYSEVIVGAPVYDAGQSDEGAAFVFLGGASGIRGRQPLRRDRRHCLRRGGPRRARAPGEPRAARAAAGRPLRGLYDALTGSSARLLIGRKSPRARTLATPPSASWGRCMLGIAGIIVFFVVGLLVSLRLLGLARQTRRLPELLAGLGLLGIGPLGFCVLMAGVLLFRGTPLGNGLRISGLGLQALGFVASAIFTCRVFRPSSDWARALAAAVCVGLLVTFVSCALTPARAGGMLLHHHLDTWLKILCLGWGALESLRYWRVTQQRVAIGVADPLVSASFLLWGISLASGALGFMLIYAALLTLQPGELLGVRVQLLLSGCGVVTAAGLYLAFLPPKAWVRRLAARASARTVPA